MSIPPAGIRYLVHAGASVVHEATPGIEPWCDEERALMQTAHTYLVQLGVYDD